jgi:hypothetical protein
MRSIVPKMFVGALILSAAACAPQQAADPDAAPEPAPPEIDPTPITDATEFTQTAVWLGADGTVRTEARTITAGEQAAQRAARTGPTTWSYQDKACNPDSLRLWDRDNFSGNEICFHGAGTVSLGDFKRTTCGPVGCFSTDWRISTGSIAAGGLDGHLETGARILPDGGVLDYTFGAGEIESFYLSPRRVTFIVLVLP